MSAPAPKDNRMYVTFWGTRGSISTPGTSTEKYGGNTSCVSVRCGNTFIILDAGTGIRNLGLELAQEAARSKTPLDLHLLLSHTHWDHIQGLPFFAPAYMPGTKLTIYGSPKKERFLESILQGQMDMDYFPVGMKALAANISIIEMSGQNMMIGDVEIDWEEQVCHPGGSVRYRLTAGKSVVVYATDVELDKLFRPECACNDHEAMATQYEAFVRNADLLIADGQYTEKEYEIYKGYGHTSINVIVRVACRQKVKQLAVFHHEPQHTDTMLDRLYTEFAPVCNNADPAVNLFWAREGMTLAV